MIRKWLLMYWMFVKNISYIIKKNSKKLMKLFVLGKKKLMSSVPSKRHKLILNFQQHTGYLNMLCNTSNQHFFRIKWHLKQKPFIFEILSRGDLCLIHSFIYFLFCTQPLQPQIFRVSKFKCFEAMQPQIWGYEIDKKL